MVLLKDLSGENNIESSQENVRKDFLQSTLEPYEALHLSRDESDDEIEYCLISLPCGATLESLNGTEMTFDDKVKEVQLPNYDCEYVNMKDNKKLSQVFLKSMGQINDDENVLSFCSLQKKIIMTKLLPSCNVINPIFLPKAEAPFLPTTIKQRNVLFGSHAIKENKKEINVPVLSNENSTAAFASNFSGSDDLFGSVTTANDDNKKLKHKKKKERSKDGNLEGKQHSKKAKKQKLSGSQNEANTQKKHKKKKNSDKQHKRCENETSETESQQAKKKKRKELEHALHNTYSIPDTGLSVEQYATTKKKKKADKEKIN